MKKMVITFLFSLLVMVGMASAAVPDELTDLTTTIGSYITWAIGAVAVILTSGFGIAGLVWGFKKLKAAMFKAA